MKKITEEWILKAEKDYLVAVRELKAEPPVTEAVCFHARTLKIGTHPIFVDSAKGKTSEG